MLPRSRVELAKAMIVENKFNQARILLEGVEGLQASAVRAKLSLSQGKQDVALAEVEAILTVDHTQCEALTVKAQALYRSRRMSDAVPAGRLAINECPNAVDAWDATALAYAANDDAANARLVFRDGISANPQNQPLVESYVLWLMSSNNTREALAAVRRLTNAAPALSSGWLLYQSLCNELNASCTRDASEGLNKSRTIFGIDLPPGERPPAGLFGRFPQS